MQSHSYGQEEADQHEELVLARVLWIRLLVTWFEGLLATSITSMTDESLANQSLMTSKSRVIHLAPGVHSTGKKLYVTTNQRYGMYIFFVYQFLQDCAQKLSREVKISSYITLINF